MKPVYIAQCWDDSLVEDIRLIEILRRYHAQATFNLNPALCEPEKRIRAWVCRGYQSWHLAVSEFKSVYDGFTLASHGMRHFKPVDHTLAEFLDDAVGAKKWIEDFFQQPVDGYAWPCGSFTPEAAAALARNGFVYGRTTENAGRITASPDPLMLPSNCHFMNPDFRKKFELARETDGAFYFWGHSCEMQCDRRLWDDFEANIAWLCGQPEVKWVSVSELVRHFRIGCSR